MTFTSEPEKYRIIDSLGGVISFHKGACGDCVTAISSSGSVYTTVNVPSTLCHLDRASWILDQCTRIQINFEGKWLLDATIIAAVTAAMQPGES